jgi:curved DNA-binding protein CbpA
VTDPYQILGVDPAVSDADLRAAYRRQVRLHHPDHNGGSLESTRRFEAVQEAYTDVLAQRRNHAAGAAAGTGRAGSRPGPRGRERPGTSGPDPDAGVESRLADLERELRQAQAERDRARRAAREAARVAEAERAAAMAHGEAPERPSDEELGYIHTDDSFSKIFADAASDLSERLSEARREHHVPKSVSDLIDELGSKLTGEPPERK